ncbi:hypothetical protein PVAP13_5NG194181 [Panicum virgatum]|uniref:Uncharacterized protein n=1 Tax=Panicum virgatum TaxID=38727 RepID=A0A8T0RSK0_PANVG|nr:hypothetical protein PVAP13_5NG194181 [Panicum virgatum]
MAGRSGGGEGGGGRTHPRLRPCSAHAASAMAVERMGSRKERRVRAEREGGGGGPTLTRQGSEGEKGGGRRRGPVAVGFARAGEEKTAAGRRRRRRPRIEDGRLWGRRPPTPAAVLPTPPSARPLLLRAPQRAPCTPSLLIRRRHEHRRTPHATSRELHRGGSAVGGPAGDGGLVAAAARRVLPPGYWVDGPMRPLGGWAAGWMGRPATGLAQLASRLTS